MSMAVLFCLTYLISTVVCWLTYVVSVLSKPPQCCSAGRLQKNMFEWDGLNLHLGIFSLPSFGRHCRARMWGLQTDERQFQGKYI